MKIRRDAKTEILVIRLTPEDKTAIEKAAEKEEMSTAEFLRAAALAYMALRLNKHALNAVLRGAMTMLAEFEEEAKEDFFSAFRKVKQA